MGKNQAPGRAAKERSERRKRAAAKRPAIDKLYSRARHRGAWVAVAAWACFIFWASAHTGSQLDYGNDLLARGKAWLTAVIGQAAGREVDVSPIGHFCEYFVFGLLIVRAFSFGNPNRWRNAEGLVRWRTVAATLLFVAFYAASDEFHQLFVSNRSCDPADWAVDMVAALIASAIEIAVVRRGQRKRKAAHMPQP